MATFDDAPQLERGADGAYVELLQRALQALNFDVGRVDRDFGGRTEQAVEAFQTTMSLKVDGIVGRATWDALELMTGLKGFVGEVADTVSRTVDQIVPGYGDDADHHHEAAPPASPAGPEGSHPTRSDAAEQVRELYQLPDDWQLLDRLRGVYLEIGQSSELFRVVPVVQARCDARIGHPVSLDSTDDMLEFLADFEAFKAEVAAHLDKVLDTVGRANDNYRDIWKDYDDEWNGNLVAEISEFFGGAVELDGREFGWVEHHIGASRAAIASGRIGTAVEEAGKATETYEMAKARWLEFSEKRLRGAGRAVSGLTFVRDGSFTIVAGLATGGAAVALETGIVGTAVIGGVATTGAELVKSTASLAGHVIAGTTEQFDVTDELLGALKAGAEQFAGGLVAGWAAKGFAGKLAGKLAARLGAQLGPNAAAIAQQAVTIAISQVPGSMAQTVVSTAGDVAMGKRFDGTLDFLEFVGEEFLKTYAENVVQDIAGEYAAKRTSAIVPTAEELAEAIASAFAASR